MLEKLFLMLRCGQATRVLDTCFVWIRIVWKAGFFNGIDKINITTGILLHVFFPDFEATLVTNVQI